MKLHRSLAATGILASLAFSATQPVAAQTLGVSLNSGFYHSYSLDGYTFGFSFDVVSPVSVSRLAYYDADRDGLNATHDLGLWAADGTMLASATVTAGAAGDLLGDFRTVSLSSPLLLATGSYRVGGTSGGDPFGYGYGAVYSTIYGINEASISTSPGIQYTGSANTFTGTNNLVDPSEDLAMDPDFYAYFGGNFVVDDEITPEPASLALLGTGFVGIAGLARRKKANA